jgi:hypothetical protein
MSAGHELGEAAMRYCGSLETESWEVTKPRTRELGNQQNGTKCFDDRGGFAR